MSLVGIREDRASAPACRPILFSGPMVRALLDGRKTQTRRVLKLPTKTFSGGPIYERPDMGGWEPCTSGGDGCFTIGKTGERVPAPETAAIWHRTTGVCMEAPIQVGDLLWVRERLECANGEAIGYPADGTWFPNDCWRWSRKSLPSIHMPRAYSRLTLTITDVRVQRLQNISADDAEAEGCPPCPRCGDCGWINSGPDGGWQCDEPGCGDAYVDQYARLWDQISGSGSWTANPWVAAYTFTVERRNIDDGRANLADATSNPLSPR